MRHDSHLTRCLVVLAIGIGAAAGTIAEAGVDTPLGNVYARERTDLSGEWRTIVDPLRQGFVQNKGSRYVFPKDIKQEPGGPLVEFDWDQQSLMTVPRDWNSQVAELQFYWGLVWYRRTVRFFRSREGATSSTSRRRTTRQRCSSTASS